jgi:hypothetical protein
VTRERWLGATGRQVPEIAFEDDLELPPETLVLDDATDDVVLRDAHAAGRPVVVRAATAEAVRAALARPEVASALIPRDRADLLELDLREITYG